MSKFNTTTKTRPDTVNKAGGTAYSRDSFENEVVSVILNSMLNGDSFYETEATRVANIERMIVENPDKAEFLAKAMVYARNQGNLRSVSHLMATILMQEAKGSSFLKKSLLKIMKRPDDATEIVALWNSRNNSKNIPNSLRRAIRESFEKSWDAYQLKKYFGKNNKVKVSDLIKLTRPTPRDEVQSVVFKQAIEGKLPNIDTAQTINASGTEDRAKKYLNLLKEGKLGYMAALKNVVNIMEDVFNGTTLDDSEKEEVVELLCALFRKKNAVVKSGVLPFRFVQSYISLKNKDFDKIKIKKVLKAIEDGFILSVYNTNLVEEDDKVAVLLDESGSMQGYSRKVSPFFIGKTLMASILTGLKKENTIGYLWADNAREISIDGSPMEFIERTNSQGYGTDLASSISDLVKTKTFVDKIIIITDLQGWRSVYGSFEGMVKNYKKINPKVKILFWNIEGYGTGTPLKLNNNVLEVSGFSDNILKLIGPMWKNPNAMIEEINSIQL